MRLLVDTNIFLEILLEQNCAEEAKNLLRKVDQHDFFISDFSLHSVGLLLLRRQRPEVFPQFLSDLVSNVGIIQLGLSPSEMEDVIEAAASFRLDFDDAYQYAVAIRHGLAIVSFDADFDRTAQGRIQPEAVI